MRRRRGRHGGENAGSAELSKRGSIGDRAGQSAALAFALCLGATSAALTADLPAPVVKAPPIYEPYNWTGFYIGGNLGAGWSELANSNFSDTLGSTFAGGTNTQFAGGGQVGVNYQFSGGMVIGAEAMFDWLTVSHNNPVTATDPTNTVAANIGTVDARWLTTATGKLGYAWDRVLLYGKGGGAWVATTSPSISVAGAPASFTGVSGTTASTWTAGFGLEWAFYGNWSVRAEYDFVAIRRLVVMKDAWLCASIGPAGEPKAPRNTAFEHGFRSCIGSLRGPFPPQKEIDDAANRNAAYGHPPARTT